MEQGTGDLNTTHFSVVRQTIEATESEIIHVSFPKTQISGGWWVASKDVETRTLLRII
ncbi:hypothetical protein N7499_005322 [Penicillium canescens]|uniref:Uncharacterized protein n=1 Tax=Penicillium canescens TaxID=5083 RepID=A0AAD6N3J9_PENCN|nr:uncharacterized protein N7446_004165 [Penicillium canescens]KAJ6009256.1 hypothetical protein N7522_004272 [Penicillium canescens]KAJ6027235.1 hypothetical protein N7460_012052 [Penicillium canescens]KAJ6040517.1 hypothetical protein N7444_009422 [Penicillium canescens]KAJ6067128.1 hypothetical protein N7446_004165 [Penicillium canescens]KAJ6085693.1 hypothetical protein N7499_005322 [Penicillium canescens]